MFCISVICLDDIKDDDGIRALRCQHIYHGSCFDRWFKGLGHDFCPLCHRKVLVASKDDLMGPKGDKASPRA
jgi:hypothetical protein